MKLVKYMDENTLIKKSIKLLMDKMGPVETIRFLNIPREKRIETIKRHREWQKNLDKDEFFNEIFGK
jgi:transposase-like protein